MTAPSQIDPATIRAAIDQARATARQIGDVQAANTRTIRTLEAALNQAIKGQLNGPSTLPPAIAEHRREHRSGFPSRIDTDPELQAFVRARIDQMTYGELVAEVAATFPPDRRVGKSALSRWSILQRSRRQSSLS
jgi:hypothetical protein